MGPNAVFGRKREPPEDPEPEESRPILPPPFATDPCDRMGDRRHTLRLVEKLAQEIEESLRDPWHTGKGMRYE